QTPLRATYSKRIHSVKLETINGVLVDNSLKCSCCLAFSGSRPSDIGWELDGLVFVAHESRGILFVLPISQLYQLESDGLAMWDTFVQQVEKNEVFPCHRIFLDVPLCDPAHAIIVHAN